MTHIPRLIIILFTAGCLSSCSRLFTASETPHPIQEANRLDALWGLYKYDHIENGRVISRDENGRTTSEGQGYALLRAVWTDDRPAFDEIWNWTQAHLQTANGLFAWSWKGRILDPHTATDADTDIALALVLASVRFSEPRYLHEAISILKSIWEKEVVVIGDKVWPAAGDWAKNERIVPLHTAYQAPYAYEIFADVDPGRPWAKLVDSTYEVLDWIYTDQNAAFPPTIIYLNSGDGTLSLAHPETGETHDFSYDAFPLFWRIAVDTAWHKRDRKDLRQKMLAPFLDEWRRENRIYDTYGIHGTQLSEFEGLPLYATLHSLAWIEDRPFAVELRRTKLDPLWERALANKPIPYYLHNWIWFDRAFELHRVRHFEEILDFLHAFHAPTFVKHFPLVSMVIFFLLYPIATKRPLYKAAFCAAGFTVSIQYLGWRIFNTLNFIEPFGVVFSGALLLAEAYGFSTVVLLLVQMGLSKKKPPPAPVPPADFSPSVDILIPLYTEPIDILERTLTAAAGLRYPNKKIYVLDDSRRPEAVDAAHRFGVEYIPGPQKHSKAENLNRGLSYGVGDLVAVLDVDHMPVSTFLKETIPYFLDQKVAFVQTPHHFYNKDIFQRAFNTSGDVPSEQAMFHHAIQDGRNKWNGAFFVGSGAVFRRTALEGIGGFSTTSLTEDILTSMRLHQAGWRSVFVDKNLIAGLLAENLKSYIGQRKRWMLGTLQIFFTSNPLFCRGLTMRQRFGYFASLYYFFFPVARLVFWITPLYYLLFHLHPILADPSILLAKLLPFLIAGPMISSVLVPRWPRLLWADLYESPLIWPLTRSMFSLLVPNRLRFHITPKGWTSETHQYDWQSTRLTMIVTAITVFALAKGIAELSFFGIEKDAYLLNIAWALLSLVLLSASLIMGWEKSQKRGGERIETPIRFRFDAPFHQIHGSVKDMSLSGFSLETDRPVLLPRDASVMFERLVPLRFKVELVYYDKIKRNRYKGAYRFIDLDAAKKQSLIHNVYAAPETWTDHEEKRTKSQTRMLRQLMKGLVRWSSGLKPRRRRTPRLRAFRMAKVVHGGMKKNILVLNQSKLGIGFVIVLTRPAFQPKTELHSFSKTYTVRINRPVRFLPFLRYVGCEISEAAAPAGTRPVPAPV